MANERQRAANRRNARKSTGPKSEGGKRRSSQNARPHGLTTPPSPDRVRVHLRLILGDDAAELAPLIADPRLQAARSLAEAEARLERARAAEEGFLLAVEEGRHLDDHLKQVSEEIRRRWQEVKGVSPEASRRILASKGKVPYEETRKVTVTWESVAARLRTLLRYRREAEVRRRKALREWIELAGLQSLHPDSETKPIERKAS
jgi:hypothetical protein